MKCPETEDLHHETALIDEFCLDDITNISTNKDTKVYRFSDANAYQPIVCSMLSHGFAASDEILLPESEYLLLIVRLIALKLVKFSC